MGNAKAQRLKTKTQRPAKRANQTGAFELLIENSTKFAFIESVSTGQYYSVGGRIRELTLPIEQSDPQAILESLD